MTFLEQFEGPVRLSVFAGIFILMAVLETAFPRKERTQNRSKRWVTNWSLVIIDTLALRVFVPILAVGFAGIATQKGWGLFNIWTGPIWLELILSIIILDMLIYAQHVASHHIPVLWRFHKVHHVDRDIDVTTGARFHPIEIVVSMAFKILCVIVLGAPAFAVFVFEVILNASAMFNHANVRLPLGVDRIVRIFLVTPDMHRIHHCVQMRETNSNFGFFLSAWDRLFKTYIAQPADGHDDMVIGLAEFQDDKPSSLWWSLLLPFKSNLSTKIRKIEANP